MLTHSKKHVKVFIVDDSSIIVERLTSMLNDIKSLLVVGHAPNISQALSGITQTKPHVVILDIHLKEDAPAANGIDLLVKLRKDYPTMVLIMLTNHAIPQYTKKCIELGANYFFDKSNDLDQVVETLKPFLNLIKNK